MGCDIHTHVEIRRDGRWIYDHGEKYEDGEITDGPFGWRNYGVFGFLANVRNYSHSPVIAEPRGLPDDVSAELRAEWYDTSGHSDSWLTVAELLTYDYDQMFWDRRVTKQMPGGGWSGAALADEGEGEHKTLREFLGAGFFLDLDALAALGDPADTRLVFWFDS